MSEFEIIKGVQMPADKRGRPAQHSVFHKMEVGDCIVIDEHARCRMVMGRARKYGLTNNMKFASRILPDGRYGIWRIA